MQRTGAQRLGGEVGGREFKLGPEYELELEFGPVRSQAGAFRLRDGHASARSCLAWISLQRIQAQAALLSPEVDGLESLGEAVEETADSEGLEDSFDSEDFELEEPALLSELEVFFEEEYKSAYHPPPFKMNAPPELIWRLAVA